MQIGYAVVSTHSLDFTLQIDVLHRASYERVYQEKASETAKILPQLEALLEQLRLEDVVVVWKLIAWDIAKLSCMVKKLIHKLI